MSVTLETACIVHFGPSEEISTVAAAFLATATAEVALFVAIGTAGAVVGSLVAHYLFGVGRSQSRVEFGTD